MATTRAQQFTILSNQTFLDQFAGSLLFQAINVLNEDPSTGNHANRLKFAQAVFDSPMLHARNLATFAMTNATLAANAGNPAGPSGTPFDDQSVDFVVAGLWDRLSDKFVGTE